MSTKILYPDSPILTTTCIAYRLSGYHNDTWPQIIARTASLSGALDPPYPYAVFIESDSVANQWYRLGRARVSLDVSDLINPTAGIFRLYGYDKLDNLSITPNVNIYSGATFAAHNTLVSADFDNFGSIPMCDTPISYANWNVGGANTFLLNANGMAAIKTAQAGDGILEVSIRNTNYDIAAISPTWSHTGSNDHTRMRFYGSYSGAGLRPSLTVTTTTIHPPYELTALEALRNVEMSAGGRVYVDEQGNLKYESRYARNPT